jgi:hypothetical protein
MIAFRYDDCIDRTSGAGRLMAAVILAVSRRGLSQRGWTRWRGIYVCVW